MGNAILHVTIRAKVDLVGGDQYGFEEAVAKKLAKAIDDLGMCLHVTTIISDGELLYEWKPTNEPT